MSWYFDEADDDVQFTDNAALALPDSNWTIAGWIKMADAVGGNHQWFLSWAVYNAIPSMTWHIVATTGELRFRSRDAGGDAVYLTSVVKPGLTTAWQHILVQRVGNTATQYIDGVADGAETDAAYGAVDVAGALFLGAHADQGAGTWFGGYMEHWAKWDRALNAGERAKLAAGYTPACIPGRVWHSKMESAYDEEIVPLTVTNDGSILGAGSPVIYPLASVTPAYRPYDRGGIYELTWQADKNGDASLWLDDVQAPLLQGVVHRVETLPSAANAPSANHDITLEDRLGADVLGGALANRSATAAEAAYPYHALGTSGHGERATIRCLEFKVANAGAGGAGVAAFYMVKA